MNIVALVNAALAGFLVSLLFLEGLRPLVGVRWPVQSDGLQVERRLLPWIIALLAGPALLWDRSLPYRQRNAGRPGDVVVLVALVAVWSASYGASLRWLLGAVV